jgi:uncharacterized protein (TIGR02001 family)
MKKQLLIASTAAVMTMASVGAIAAEASANVAFTTDYRFRGISQTDRDFALQGGFDYAWDSGVYIGTWASNVDGFSSNPIDGDGGAQAELDFYAGYGFAITDTLSFDFNTLYFYYPGASTAGNQPEIDYWEFTPGISYSGETLSAGLSVSYSDDFFGESGDAFYYNGTVDVPLTDYLALGLHAGYQTIDDNEAFGTPDYADWSISLGTSMFGLDWSVAYVDTDLSYDECFGGDNLCGATAVGTVAKSF